MLHTYCWNYFHFVLEALPKFQLIEKSGLPADIPLIFDSIVKNTPQFMELIDIFNTENREIIFIDKLHWHKVGRLYLFTPVQVFPLNFANINATTLSDMLYHKESIDFIKQRIADAAAKEPEQKKSYPEKIFLSRKNTTRRPYNDAEVEQSLQPFGYSTILTGGMSVKEQCRLFSSVTKIVAPSGAALTNIIFCAPGTHVLVLYSIRKLTSTFSTLAAVLGLDMEFFIGKPENLNDIHTAFTIDTDSLQKYLSHVRDFS